MSHQNTLLQVTMTPPLEQNHQTPHRRIIFTFKKPKKLFGEETFSHSITTEIHDESTKSEINFNFICDICCKSFESRDLINNHIKAHVKTSCPNCQSVLTRYTFKNQKEFTPVYKCNVCHKIFSRRKNFYIHSYGICTTQEVQCDYCHKLFRSKPLLKEHIRTHIKDSCPTCGKPISRHRMEKHMKLVHSKGEAFLACHIAFCRQKFANIEDLNEHQEFHIGVARYKCPKCSYETKSLQNISLHLKKKIHQ